MYQEEVKPNPAILKKYILTGKESFEWVVQLYECPSYYADHIGIPNRPKYRVVAVYRPTGRVFSENANPAWEYEYEGIRVYD